MARKTHCPIPGCLTPKKGHEVMCHDHWFMVPWQLRETVWDEYRRHRGTPEHLGAIRAAISSVLEHR